MVNQDHDVDEPWAMQSALSMMRRNALFGLLALTTAGCDPARVINLHNDLGEAAQATVLFHLSDNKPDDVEKDQLNLAESEVKEAMLSHGSCDWVEVSWRSAHHAGTRRFERVNVPRNEEDVHLTASGVAFGPLSTGELIDEKLGATKPFVVGTVAFGIVVWVRRKVVANRQAR